METEQRRCGHDELLVRLECISIKTGSGLRKSERL